MIGFYLFFWGRCLKLHTPVRPGTAKSSPHRQPSRLEPGADVESYDVSKLSEEVLQHMEADTFWCTTKLLDGIQDNYTFAQPGVQTKVQRLQELNESIDGGYKTTAC